MRPGHRHGEQHNAAFLPQGAFARHSALSAAELGQGLQEEDSSVPRRAPHRLSPSFQPSCIQRSFQDEKRDICLLEAPLRTQHPTCTWKATQGTSSQSLSCSWVPGGAKGDTEEPPRVSGIRSLSAEEKMTPETGKTPAAPTLLPKYPVWSEGKKEGKCLTAPFI